MQFKKVCTLLTLAGIASSVSPNIAQATEQVSKTTVQKDVVEQKNYAENEKESEEIISSSEPAPAATDPQNAKYKEREAETEKDAEAKTEGIISSDAETVSATGAVNKPSPAEKTLLILRRQRNLMP